MKTALLLNMAFFFIIQISQSIVYPPINSKIVQIRSGKKTGNGYIWHYQGRLISNTGKTLANIQGMEKTINVNKNCFIANKKFQYLQWNSDDSDGGGKCVSPVLSPIAISETITLAPQSVVLSVGTPKKQLVSRMFVASYQKLKHTKLSCLFQSPVIQAEHVMVDSAMQSPLKRRQWLSIQVLPLSVFAKDGGDSGGSRTIPHTSELYTFKELPFSRIRHVFGCASAVVNTKCFSEGPGWALERSGDCKGLTCIELQAKRYKGMQYLPKQTLEMFRKYGDVDTAVATPSNRSTLSPPIHTFPAPKHAHCTAISWLSQHICNLGV